MLLNYSSEATSPTTKHVRRKRTNKDWILVDVYETYEEALHDIKAQQTWSICSSNAAYVLFRCNKVQKGVEQCKSGLRVEMHEIDLGVILFASRNEHNCDQLVSACAKMTLEVKEFIANLHAKGLKLKAIQDEFIKEKSRYHHVLHCKMKLHTFGEMPLVKPPSH